MEQFVEAEQLESTPAPQSLVKYEADQYMERLTSIEEKIVQQQFLERVVKGLLIEADENNFAGADYGVLPGTKERALFQNGAQKLAKFFGLNVVLQCVDSQEKWDIPGGFFKYTYRATVHYNGQPIINVERSCHTKEKKYAWKWVETRREPTEEEAFECEQLETGKWSVAWKNADFKPNKAEGARLKAEGKGRWRQVSGDWVWQVKGGRVWIEARPNPDAFSLQFVVQAMAQKRAYVAVVKAALAAAGFFSAKHDESDVKGAHEKARDARTVDYFDDQAPAATPPVEPRPSAKPESMSREPESPEVERANAALLDFCIKKRGEKLGPAYFEGVYLIRTGDERIAEAKKLNLIMVDVAAPAECPVAKQESATEKQRGILFNLITELASAKAMTTVEIEDRIGELCGGQTVINDLSLGELTCLVAEFSTRLDKFICEKEERRNKAA